MTESEQYKSYFDYFGLPYSSTIDEAEKAYQETLLAADELPDQEKDIKRKEAETAIEQIRFLLKESNKHDLDYFSIEYITNYVLSTSESFLKLFCMITIYFFIFMLSAGGREVFGLVLFIIPLCFFIVTLYYFGIFTYEVKSSSFIHVLIGFFKSEIGMIGMINLFNFFILCNYLPFAAISTGNFFMNFLKTIIVGNGVIHYYFFRKNKTLANIASLALVPLILSLVLIINGWGYRKIYHVNYSNTEVESYEFVNEFNSAFSGRLDNNIYPGNKINGFDYYLGKYTKSNCVQYTYKQGLLGIDYVDIDLICM